MYHFFACVLALCTCTACTLSQPLPEDDLRPQVQAQAAQLATAQQALSGLQAQFDALTQRLTLLEPFAARVAILEALQARMPEPARKGKPGRGEKALPSKMPTPQEIVQIAHREAEVLPSERGYWGKSAEQVYLYQPGRIYTVLLTWNHPTLIFLPPGELLAMGLNLPEEQYDIKNDVAGHEPLAYGAVSIRPKIEKGETQAFLLAQSGRRYLFHFLCGEKGMLAVTFEHPNVTQASQPEPRLILPRPSQ